MAKKHLYYAFVHPYLMYGIEIYAYTYVKFRRTGISGNWCWTSVEFYWIGVGNKCLWCVVKVGSAMKGRGRFVRDVCGN